MVINPQKNKIIKSLDDFYNQIDIHKYKNISFHHHLRNGDFVLNQVLHHYLEQNVTNINLFPSAIFPSYTTIVSLLENNQIQNITTNYCNGPVANYISKHGLPGKLVMQTHGGRARAILEGRNQIDIAYLAVPACDPNGNAVGYIGDNRCGALGYAVPDSQKATFTVLITDHLVDEIKNPEIKQEDVDFIILVDAIGDKNGIVSGTTKVTTNPIGVTIAKNTAKLLRELNMIKEGFSFQSGAGGVSLKVTQFVKETMKKQNIKASFFSGGITKYHVDMLEEGLVEKLYDVQCFDLDAVESISRNQNHIPISASKYANPNDENMVIKDLDIVILGATEIDYDFNVNVTTDSHGNIIGGSGGHSDTASEAKLTVIVSPLMKGRIPIIRDRVTTITTLGKHVDCIVTERGIAINPIRTDLLNQLQQSKLNIVTIKELAEIAFHYTNIPSYSQKRDKIIGEVEDRTFDIVDYLYQK